MIRWFENIIATGAPLKCDLAFIFGLEAVSFKDIIVHLIICKISIDPEHLHTAPGPASPVLHLLIVQAIQYPASDCLMPERMGIDPLLDPCIPGNILDGNTNSLITQWLERLIYCGPQGCLRVVLHRMDRKPLIQITSTPGYGYALGCSGLLASAGLANVDNSAILINHILLYRMDVK